MRFSLFKYLMVFLFITNTTFAQNQMLDIDEIMSKVDRIKTGITKISQDEKRALEIWLTNWSREIYNFVQKVRTNSNNSSKIYANTGSGHWISKN